jgi:hypothetical protein
MDKELQLCLAALDQLKASWDQLPRQNHGDPAVVLTQSRQEIEKATWPPELRARLKTSSFFEITPICEA